MSNWDWSGKLLGLGLGWVVKGPVGAILGGLLGAVYDETDPLKGFRMNDTDQIGEREERAVYHAYLVTLFVYIAKADGNLSPIEVRIIRDFFQRKGISGDEMAQVREALKIASRQKIVAINSVISQINELFDYPTRYNILELCFHIAAADKALSRAEQTRLEELGNQMRISQSDQYGLQIEYGFSTGTTNQHRTQTRQKSIDDELEDLKRQMRGEKSTNQNQRANQRQQQQKRKQSNSQSKPKRPPRKTAWEILGVSKKSTAREVKKRYLKLAAANHPDKFSDPKQKAIAEEKIKEINLAYQELKRYFN